MQPRLLRILVLGATVLGLAACSSGPTSRIDYKEAKSLPTLEMPPDLTRPAEQDSAPIPATLSRQGLADPAVTQLGPDGVLPIAAGIRVERDRSTRWLVVDTPAAELWPRLRDFWPTIGLTLESDLPQLGIMETEWAENRADAPGGFLTTMVRKVFSKAYSAGTRDKYRLRIEPREDGGSEIFLSHYGLQEQLGEQRSEFVETVWTVRPADPELVQELLNRIIVHLGGDAIYAARLLDQAEEPPARTRLQADTLHVSEGLSRTWRRTGIALDEVGLVVEDRNLSEGIYYVRRFDALADDRASRGWFRSLFGGAAAPQAEQNLQVVLSGDESSTRIVLRDSQGRPLSSQDAQPILQKLAELLK